MEEDVENMLLWRWTAEAVLFKLKEGFSIIFTNGKLKNISLLFLDPEKNPRKNQICLFKYILKNYPQVQGLIKLQVSR